MRLLETAATEWGLGIRCLCMLVHTGGTMGRIGTEYGGIPCLEQPV